MPTKPRKVPSYRLHKPTGQAVVRIDGRDHYLGVHGTDASHEAYRRTTAEWLTHAASQPAPRPGRPDAPNLSVNELILAFWTRYAEQHYRLADGTPTGELGNYSDSLRPFRHLYGTTSAADFGPLALKAVRQTMIDAGLARSTINQRVGRIVRLFKWAVENELVPPAVHQALNAVQGLQRGRSGAREPEPVRPASESDVEAIRPFVARQVWTMVQLQRLTGMRPGEVCRMRTCDLDTSGAIWVYSPAGHKTAHHGFKRGVYLGPRAQEVLRPWVEANTTTYLFSPRQAVEERLAERRRLREAEYGGARAGRKGRARAPGRAPGERYRTQTYHHAVQYGCKRAGIPAWHPHQLRHNAGTWLRREFGVEVARVILGHGRLETTEIYAEADRDKAVAIMERVG
jgi:integrase